MYTVSINLLDGRVLWFYNLATYREALQITECTGLDYRIYTTIEGLGLIETFGLHHLSFLQGNLIQ